MKARLDSSRCMFLPQFWERACASYKKCQRVGMTTLPEAGRVPWTNLEGVELDVCVAVGEALDHALDGLLGAICIAGNLVTHLHDGAPVLRGEVLIGRLG